MPDNVRPGGFAPHEHDCLICGPYECRKTDCDLPYMVKFCAECNERRCRICQKIGPDKHHEIPSVPWGIGKWSGWVHPACVAEERRRLEREGDPPEREPHQDRFPSGV